MQTATTQNLLNHPELHTLIKYAQMLPQEMLAGLQKAAGEKGLSVELEIASRLLATFIEPEALKIISLLQQILDHTFSQADAVAECARQRQAALYAYELEKLRLFIRFEHRMPRGMKEEFLVLNFKEAAKQIRAEFEREKKKEGE